MKSSVVPRICRWETIYKPFPQPSILHWRPNTLIRNSPSTRCTVASTIRNKNVVVALSYYYYSSFSLQAVRRIPICSGSAFVTPSRAHEIATLANPKRQDEEIYRIGSELAAISWTVGWPRPPLPGQSHEWKCSKLLRAPTF